MQSKGPQSTDNWFQNIFLNLRCKLYRQDYFYQVNKFLTIKISENGGEHALERVNSSNLGVGVSQWKV